jgi:hypothetical protein
MRDNSVDDTKYRINNAPQLHPAAAASVPTNAATTVPPRVKAPARKAASEINAAKANPDAKRPITAGRLEGDSS